MQGKIQKKNYFESGQLQFWKQSEHPLEEILTCKSKTEPKRAIVPSPWQIKKAKWNVKAVYLWFLQTWGPRIESRSFFRFFLNNRHIDMTHKHKNVYETCQTWEKNIWKIGIWTRVALLWSRALACTAILSQSFGRKITGYIKEKAMIYWFYAYDAKRHCK